MTLTIFVNSCFICRLYFLGIGTICLCFNAQIRLQRLKKHLKRNLLLKWRVKLERSWHVLFMAMMLASLFVFHPVDFSGFSHHLCIFTSL